MASKSAASRSGPSTTASVRRNLFQHHLSRRPTSASTSTSTSGTTLLESPQDDYSDIAIRDRNGNYQVQILTLPPLDEDQAHEEDLGNEKESMLACRQARTRALTPYIELDARLLEMYRDKSLQPGEPGGQSASLDVHIITGPLTSSVRIVGCGKS